MAKILMIVLVSVESLLKLKKKTRAEQNKKEKLQI